MKLRLTDFDSNTYEDTDGSCEYCMTTGMYDHPRYTFTDSYGGKHVVEGWWSEWGFLYSYDVNVPVFAHWLHTAEFKEPIGLSEELDHPSDKDFWEAFLTKVLQNAHYCSNEEELNEELDWALKEEKPKPSTVVLNKDGTEYDLVCCAIGPCAITVEGTYYLFVEDGVCGSDYYEEYWMSTWGSKLSTSELAEILNGVGGDFDIIQD